MLESSLERVIDRIRIGSNHPDARIHRIGTPILNRAWTRVGLIEVIETGIHMGSFAPDPTDLQHIAVAQLA